MIIDSHIHFWRLARGDNCAINQKMKQIYLDREPHDLKHLLDLTNVEKIIVVQGALTHSETLYIIGLSVKFPWINGIIGWVDPNSCSIEEEILALKLTGIFKGIRPVNNEDNISIAWLLDQRLNKCWDILKSENLVLEILLQNPNELPLLTHFSKNHPKLNIILDHCGKPNIADGKLETWSNDIKYLSENENVFCKFSGLMNCAYPSKSIENISRYSDHVISVFGSDRLLWGSDWPPLDLASNYEEWFNISLELLSNLNENDISKILGQNAQHIYNLK